MRLSRFVSISAVAALALSLAACGSDQAVDNGSDKKDAETTSTWSGTLAGAGASSQEAAMQAWTASFQSNNSGANVTYDPVGSGAGLKQMGSGKVSFAGSDSVMKDEEREAIEKTCGSPALHLPVYISPIAIVFNLEGVDEINMDPDTIAKVFRGEINKWNDPAIAKQNPDVKLPDTQITPVHRSDESGTTDNFTDYLHAAAPEAWPDEHGKAWPLEGGEAGDKTQGMIDTVKKADGTIGYADASQAGDLGTVKLKAGDDYVAYSEEAAAKSAEIAKQMEGLDENDHALQIDRVPKDADAYPLILISYEVVCSKYSDADTGKGVKAFMTFLASDEGQKLGHEHAGSAPLSPALAEKVQAAIDSIK